MYLDPGIGSVILQAVIAAIAGIAVFFRVARKRLFGRDKKAADETENANENLE